MGSGQLLKNGTETLQFWMHGLQPTLRPRTTDSNRLKVTSAPPKMTPLFSLSPFYSLIACLYQSISLEKCNKLEDLVDCGIFFEEAQN